MQTITEKIELIGFVIFSEIKLCNFKNIHCEKKSPKSYKKA